jgi:hypothetical protein
MAICRLSSSVIVAFGDQQVDKERMRMFREELAEPGKVHISVSGEPTGSSGTPTDCGHEEPSGSPEGLLRCVHDIMSHAARIKRLAFTQLGAWKDAELTTAALYNDEAK